ncbi:hypothetical protein FHR32_008619 [Streptosporangium album]|uniref:Uncharacterized protein n=1 Tax=Streptosporangium album TaxID=47479 RepID=A0A7W7S7E2_9ACTN|nr:hypothetical protein [Streptosporangium album]
MTAQLAAAAEWLAVRIGEVNRPEVLDDLAARTQPPKATNEREYAHRRAWGHRRILYYPCVEEMLAVAPAATAYKIRPGFHKAQQAERAKITILESSGSSIHVSVID